MPLSVARRKMRKSTAKARKGKKRERLDTVPDGFDTLHSQVQLSKQNQSQSISLMEQATTPQQGSPFLTLPLEIRLLIWQLVILPFNNHLPLIPHRHKNHFICPGWITAALDTRRVSEICRQSYIDVVGGGLLYRFKTFAFESPALLRGYFSGIQECCRDRIGKIHLQLPIKTPILAPSTKRTFHILSQLPSLKSLTLTLEFQQDTLGVHQARWHPNDEGDLPWSVEDFHLDQIRDCAELRSITGLKEFRFRVFTTGEVFGTVVDVFEEGGEVDGEIRDVEKFVDYGWWFAVEEDRRRVYSVCTLNRGAYVGKASRDPNPSGQLRERVNEVERVLRGVMCDV